MRTPPPQLLFIPVTCSLIVTLLSATGFCAEEPTKDSPKNPNWEFIELEGKKYVTAANIAKFYGFSAFKQNTEQQSAVFFHSSIGLVLNAEGDHKMITVNKVPILAINETIWEEENKRLLLSMADLASILDPVIRPSYIKIKNSEAERNRPYFFTLKGDETLIKKFDQDKLIEKLEYHGLKAVKERDDIDIIHTKLVFELESDATKPDQVATQWFWELSNKETNPLSIALAMAIHSHLSHSKALKGGVLSPRKIEGNDQFPARAEVVFTLNESFDSFAEIHSSIADAIGKNRRSVLPR